MAKGADAWQKGLFSVAKVFSSSSSFHIFFFLFLASHMTTFCNAKTLTTQCFCVLKSQTNQFSERAGTVLVKQCYQNRNSVDSFTSFNTGRWAQRKYIIQPLTRYIKFHKRQCGVFTFPHIPLHWVMAHWWNNFKWVCMCVWNCLCKQYVLEYVCQTIL